MADLNKKREPEFDHVWDLPIKTGLQCAAELQKHLSIDEENYLSFAGQLLNDCRSYVLYIALDEVTKASMHLMRLRDLLDEKEDTKRSGETGWLDRLLTTSVLEEQQMRIRRLLELLVTLILFSTTNEQSYYRHLLLLEDLEQRLSENTDLQDFWDQRSANIGDYITHQIQWISQIESNINLKLCWYLRKKSPIQPPEKLNPGQILSSFSSRLKKALPLMTDNERIVAGYTYNGVYGSSSEAIHYRSNRSDYRISSNEMIFNIRRLGLLISSIIDRCYRLLNKPDAPRSKQISESLEHSGSSDIIHKITVGTGEVGDFVLVHGDIAEIIESKQSRYGYQTYKVHYLAERPKQNIPDDWSPAPYIQAFYPKRRFRKTWNSYVKNGDIPADIRNVLNSSTEEEIQLALRQSMKDIWNITLRDQIKGQQRGNK